MKPALSLVFLFIASSAQAQPPACSKPYRLGHFVQLPGEDLRQDRTRVISQKESKEWTKRQTAVQTACNAFVSKHPNVLVSKDFSFTVKGFVTVNERCESFCGTDEELMQLYQREKK